MKSSIAFAASLAGAFLASSAAAQLTDAPPVPPPGIAASYAPPSRDGAGRYLTPNRDLSAAETIWHVRVALNVAALGCRDAREAETIAHYNALLDNNREALSAAQAGMTARYREKFGAAWQARNDDAMTKLYNFFAQSVAHDEFCAAAQTALDHAATMEPADLPAFAAVALPELEAPFLAFFARYDGYREQLAAWRADHMPQVVIATVAAAPVALGPPQ